MLDLANMDLEKLEKALLSATPFERALIKWRLEMLQKLRPKQIAPRGDWSIWLVISGRGFGKNFLASFDAISYAADNPGVRVAAIGATHGDTRKTVFEGDSGIIRMMPPAFFLGGDVERGYNRSLLQISLANGSMIAGYSAEEPDRMRGPNNARAICDEIASWTKLQETWDNLQMTLRAGTDPRTVIVSTPRPLPFLKDLVSRAGQDVIVTTGSSYENADNLAPSFLENIRQRYENTRIGDQEIHGRILDSIDGALWQQSTIDQHRVAEAGPYARIVIGVDPSGSSGKAGDETGIIVAGSMWHGDVEHFYIIEDASLRGSPREWGRAVVEAYHRHSADKVVVETNFGAAMATDTIRNVDGNVPIESVTASRGKQVRAEPISVLYSQGRVHHVGRHKILEDQLCAMTYSGYQGGSAGRKSQNASTGDDEELSKSPDRLDAAIWALTELSGQDADAGWFSIGQQRY